MLITFIVMLISLYQKKKVYSRYFFENFPKIEKSDDFEKKDKTKKYIDAIKRDRKKPSAKKNGRDVNVTSPVGDDKPETDTRNLIQVGNQVGYPEEGITYKHFQEKVRSLG